MVALGGERRAGIVLPSTTPGLLQPRPPGAQSTCQGHGTPATALCPRSVPLSVQQHRVRALPFLIQVRGKGLTLSTNLNVRQEKFFITAELFLRVRQIIMNLT